MRRTDLRPPARVGMELELCLRGAKGMNKQNDYKSLVKKFLIFDKDKRVLSVKEMRMRTPTPQRTLLTVRNLCTEPGEAFIFYVGEWNICETGFL